MLKSWQCKEPAHQQERYRAHKMFRVMYKSCRAKFILQCMEIYAFSSNRNNSGSWNLPLWKTGLLNIVNTMAADILAMQGARVSAAIVLIQFSWNIQVSTMEGLLLLFFFFFQPNGYYRVALWCYYPTVWMELGLITPHVVWKGSYRCDLILCIEIPGPRLNIKTVLSTYGDFHVKDKTAVRTSYL